MTTDRNASNLPLPPPMVFCAAVFLGEFLRHGPKPAGVVLEHGQVVGYSASSLRRARPVAGVESVKVKGVWHWAMADQQRRGMEWQPY